MALLDQIERVAGRKIPVAYAEEVIADFGVERKEFWATLERKGHAVDIRAFIEGREKPGGPLLLLISEHKEGFLIRLWAWWEFGGKL
jgi:hypothetical protein